MTPPTLVAPELEAEIEQLKDDEHPPRRNGSGASQSRLAVSSDSELQKLNEQELKAAIKSAWKKYERLAKKEMGQLLYWLREKLRAQGSRNDIHDKDRGFGAWVEENLDISRRTADRWADWYAVENGLKESTSGQLTKSEDDDFYAGVLDQHKGKQQIAFNYWIKKAVHAQFQKALTKIQKQLGLKNKKDALVQGVLYAAEAMDGTAKSGRLSGVVGQLSLRQHKSKSGSNVQVRTTGRSANGGGKKSSFVPVVARTKGKSR